MENLLARGVKMTVWYAQQGAAKRQNSSNYLEGKLDNTSYAFNMD
jgi:hypothetical protein